MADIIFMNEHTDIILYVLTILFNFKRLQMLLFNRKLTNIMTRGSLSQDAFSLSKTYWISNTKNEFDFLVTLNINYEYKDFIDFILLIL